MEDEQLTPVQYEALCLIAAGYTSQEVAEKTGVSTRTVDRWRAKPNFKQMLKEAVSKVFDAALAELVSGSRAAAKELKLIIADPDVSTKTKVSAINALLSHAGRAKDSLLEERVEKLELLLDGSNQEQNTEA